MDFDIAEDGKETVNSDAPENNPQYTTVYVGNLAPEASYLIFIYIIYFKCFDLSNDMQKTWQI